MNRERVNEIVSSLKSFEKEKYMKSEILSEMLALQQEIVNRTFNDEHASTAGLKIWDVEKHLDQLNKDCGNVADEELRKFMEGSKTLCNMIKAEISGNRGEAKAFRTLQFIHSKNIILKNVELSDGDLRTELDAVVITPSGITIIEVKNTSKNIFIDENGNYFRTGEFLRLDCNIAEKITVKEELLWRALARAGIEDIRIRSLVAFTDMRIEVQNKYDGITTCFVNQLPHIIDGFENEAPYSDEMMEKIKSTISAAESKVAYPFVFDVEEYKHDFATVMAILEEAAIKKNAAECKQEVTGENRENSNILRYVNRGIVPKPSGFLGSAAAVVLLAAVSVIALGSVRNG